MIFFYKSLNEKEKKSDGVLEKKNERMKKLMN